MKRALTMCTILLLCWPAFGQGKWDANWCFGYRCGIDFNDTANPVNYQTKCNNLEPAASISDSNGHLLFYLAPNIISDEFNPYRGLFDSTGNTIRNGDSIKTVYGFTITDGALILPAPGRNDRFYLFHLSYFDSITHVSWWYETYYSVIEKDSSGYKVVDKNHLLLHSSSEEVITAVRHANGKDWWIISRGATISGPSDLLNVFLLTKDTITGPFTQHIGSFHYPQYGNGGQEAGVMAFNFEGTRMVTIGSEQDKIDLVNFDRCTGEASLLTSLENVGPKDSLNSYGFFYSGQFSPDGSKLYAALSGDTNYLYQYNLDTSDINSSKTIIWQDTFPSVVHHFGQMQIAPNQKIYLVVTDEKNTYTPENQYLWQIANPNTRGGGCNLLPNNYFIGDSARTLYGLPNFPNYNLGPIGIYATNAGQGKAICKHDSVGITIGTPTVPNIVYSWSPGKGLSDSTIAQPTAKPDTDTYYILTVTDTSQSNNSCTTRSDTVLVSVQKCDTTGINHLTTNPVKVHPNPAQNSITVEWPDDNLASGKTEMVLYDLVGRVVLQQKVQGGKAVLDIGYLPAGAYMYRLSGSGGVIGAGKVMK